MRKVMALVMLIATIAAISMARKEAALENELLKTEKIVSVQEKTLDKYTKDSVDEAIKIVLESPDDKKNMSAVLEAAEVASNEVGGYRRKEITGLKNCLK